MTVRDRQEKPRGANALADLLAAESAIRAAARVADRWADLYRHANRDTLAPPALDRLLRDALRAIARALRADAVSLLIANEQRNALVSRAAYGMRSEVDLSVSIPEDSRLSGPILATGISRIVDDLTDLVPSDSPLRLECLRAFVGVPLRVSGRPFGVLHATRHRAGGFTKADAEMLELLAGPLAAAIDRVELFESERRARRSAEAALEQVEAANRRLEGLQRVTAALAGASRLAEVCEVILHESVPEIIAGDAQRAIWILRDGKIVLLAGGPESENFPSIGLDAPLPAPTIVLSGESIFVEGAAELGARWPVLANGPTRSFAGLAMRVGSRPLGVMGIGLHYAHRFSPEERRYLQALADQAATAVVRAEAQEALEVARQIADHRREQLRFLAVASDRLGRSLDIEPTLETIAALATPELCDRCTLYLAEDATIRRRVLDRVSAVPEADLLDPTGSHTPVPANVVRVLSNGTSVYVEEGACNGAEPCADDRTAGSPGFKLVTALRARGRILGALTFLRLDRPIERETRVLLEELSARAAVALDNALLYGREVRVATRLAESLLPTRLPRIEGVEVAARYEAGSAGLDVGGDFYDLFAVGPDSWMAVVGDVQGKGVEAAAMTGLARHTVKSGAIDEVSPAALLRRLNTALMRHIVESAPDARYPWDGARLCTAVVMRFDRLASHWRVTVSCAGHPPPMLRAPDGRVSELCAPARLLGFDHLPEYRDLTVELELGSSVISYSDGISDRLADDGCSGVDALAELLAGIDGTARELTDAIVDVALSRPSPRDDMVVLTLSILEDDRRPGENLEDVRA